MKTRMELKQPTWKHHLPSIIVNNLIIGTMMNFLITVTLTLFIIVRADSEFQIVDYVVPSALLAGLYMLAGYVLIKCVKSLVFSLHRLYLDAHLPQSVPSSTATVKKVVFREVVAGAVTMRVADVTCRYNEVAPQEVTIPVYQVDGVDFDTLEAYAYFNPKNPKECSLRFYAEVESKPTN